MRNAVGVPLLAIRRRDCTGFATLLTLAACGVAVAQGPGPTPRLRGMIPAGARSFLSNSSGSLGFGISNPTAQDLDARVLTFYEGASEKQYGRDLWVPAKATRWSWFCIGPPAHPPDRGSVELKSRLYDRRGAEDHLLKSREGPPLQTDLIPYEKRDPITTVMLDMDLQDGSGTVPSREEETRADELRELVRVFRETCGLSVRLSSVNQRFLPPIPEALEGIDQFVLGSDRIADDVDGQRALRGWVERGGHLWIPLDLIGEETVAALLGDVLDLQVVDRTSLTTVRMLAQSGSAYAGGTEPRDFEAPVALVRVLAPNLEVFYTIDGWPAACSADIGRGRVFFTMVGARGWTRPRLNGEPPSRFREFPRLPVPTMPFQYLADELQTQPERPPIPAKVLGEYVTDQISYRVVDRSLILLVFGAFFLCLASASALFSRRGLLEHLGWAGPGMALVAGAAFVGLGNHARSAVPPTLAVTQIVDVVTGGDVAQASGYLGVYRPDLSSASIGAQAGGTFDLDFTGLEGRVHNRVQTDFDRWHWDNLELPTGVRLAPFNYSIPADQHMGVTLRIGAEGVEGQVAAGPFQHLEDALLMTPGAHALPVTLGADGAFRAAGEDGLLSGQMIGGGLLSDRQRTRQFLYEKILAEPQPRYLANRGLFLVWADPVDMHFTMSKEAQLTGTALLMIPFQLERTPPGTQVVVPTALVDCQKVGGEGRLLPPVTEARFGTTVRLRFQLPAAVLPLNIQSARLSFKMRAPSRGVVINGFSAGEAVPLRSLTSPFGIEQVEISDARLLQLDKHGALYLSIAVSDVRTEATVDPWHLDWLGLEVHGRTADKQ
ncbi:MAG TPA: hypothetical protein VGP68_10025 [Gemmataceae bacterium]|nr:hypothetical protein [Gemmataceae bacterium]